MQNIDRLSWERLSPLLDRALDLDAAERTAFLASVRTSAPELADRLEALMAAHARVANSDFLAQGPGGVVEALRPDLAGQTIGAYTLDRKLGQGGMGAVWLAHRSDGRFSGQVALKLVNHAVFDATARDRFEREGTILARLSHPNISRLLDAGVTTAGQPYLVLEYVEGTHIDDYADRHRLDVTARLGLFLQVAEAVAHAHENLVVHRDLKPSNILVRPDGTVKLLDFGIAKLLTDEASNAAADASHATALVLTPKYAAPEQVREGIVSTVTDVYALGVLLFLLLAGRHPTAPEASSAADYLRAIERQPDRIDAVLRAIANDAAQATRIAEARGTTIERLQRRCSGELETILTVALRTDPADRYRSVAAFADDIRRHLRREPVSVQPDSWWYRTSRLIARRRLESVAAAVTAVGILAGAGVAVWQARVAQQQRDRALVAEAEARALNTYLVDELLTASTPERAQGQPVSVADVLGRASRSVGYAFADRPMLEAHMRATLARSYLAIGALGEARAHGTAAREVLVRVAATDAMPELRARALLARITLDEGHYADARPELEAVVAAQEALVGALHPDPVSSRVLLARALRQQSELLLAEQQARRAAANAAAIVPADWRIDAEATTELVRVLSKLNRGLEAERLVERLVARQRSHLGPSHPDVIRTLTLHADVLALQLRGRDALDVRQQLVSLREVVQGPDHPDTARELYDLSRALVSVGREDDALVVLQRSHDILARTLGPEHASTVMVLRGIGILRGKGDGGFAQALPIYRQVLDIRERTLGDLHFDTLEAAGALSILYARAGKMDDARAVGRDVVRRCELVLARADADGVKLARCSDFFLDARPDDLRNRERALVFAQRSVAATARQEYDSLRSLANAHDALGQPAEAIAVLREALRLPQAIQSWSSERLFVNLMRAHGSSAELERWLLDRLDQFARLRGPDDPLSAHTLAHLARLYAADRPEMAEARLTERLALLRKHFPEPHWQVARAKSELGAHLAGRRAYVEAETLVLAAMRDLRADPYVPDTHLDEARANIVKVYTAWNRRADADAWSRRALR
ncbi:MAG: serine/threonine protein kinase [Acidobacteria bacterium]|nr:serine/threonine protein kinase [Acidobacteriota bacterium]